MHSTPRLREMIGDIAGAGLQPMVHAVGERAQLSVCNVATELGLQHQPQQRRLRLEHAGNFVSHPSVLEAWAQAGAVPVPNIVMLYSFGAYIPRYLGAYGSVGRFPLRTLRKAGWRTSAGSDSTGDEPLATNPMFGVWAAVARQSIGGSVVEPDEALSVDEALRMYTVDGAEALGEGDRLGTLERGKIADLVILDKDPTQVPPEALRTIRVDGVYMDGKEVFWRRGASRPR